MSGPILLAVLGLIIFLLWKYSEHVKKLWPSKAPSATTAGGATPTAPAPGSADEKAGRIRLWWTIALAVIGVVVFYFGVYASAWESPNVADLGSKGRNHWLALLIVWGIGAAVVALNAKVLGAAAKTLQWLLAGIILAIIVVLPAWVHISSDVSAGLSSKIPIASTNESEWTKESLSWPPLVMPARGRTELIPIRPGMYMVVVGNGYFTHVVYKNNNGECVVEKNECTKNLPQAGAYITNETDQENTVRYAFAYNK